MDTENVPLMEKSPDSSLTESWNVVDAQEVNNGSEGSDGESIEVIDEEAHNDPNPDCGSPLISEYSNSRLLSDNRVDSICHEEKCIHEPSDNEGIEIIRPMNETHNESTSGLNMLVALISVGFLVSLMLSGSAVFLCFYKFEEYALNHFMNLMSLSSSPENNVNEYQELLDQIKTYKEESQDLKGIVADLNAAVVNLKNELASKNSGQNSENSANHIPNEGNHLFEQLLSINSGDFPNDNDSDSYVPEKYENSFRIIQDMLKRLTVGNEREENLETIKLFYLIPKHLSVLNAHYSTNENIRLFIDSWKEKLSVVNENLIADMKEMQLKMIRHTVKHLKNSEKSFFKRLCELKDLKKTECYEVFIKPYENSSNDVEDLSEISHNKRKYASNNEDENKASCNTKAATKGGNMKQKQTNDNEFKHVDNKNSFNEEDEFNANSAPLCRNANKKKQVPPGKPLVYQPKKVLPKKAKLNDAMGKVVRAVAGIRSKVGVGDSGGKVKGRRRVAGS